MVKKIGILDPEGKNINPMNGEKYRDLYTENPEYQEKHKMNNYQFLAQKTPDGRPGGWSDLKVWSRAEEIIKQIKDHQVLVIESGTGTGKTVILPKLALHALDYKGKVVVTVPKTSLAVGSAGYAAKCLDVKLGEEVGFQHRGAQIDEVVGYEDGEDIIEAREAKSSKTKLLFSTDGMLRAQLNKDPKVKNFDLVMIDEAHERNSNIDLLIFKLRQALLENDNLKVIVTSATMDMDLFVNYFRDKGINVATNTVSAGENKPVKLEYCGKGVNKNNVTQKAVDLFFNKIVKPDLVGDTIIFANSEGEGNKMCEMIRRKDKNIYCLVATSKTLEKYPELEDLAKSKELYKETFADKNYKRKVIIATDVWESSITLKELIFVIDNGLSLNAGYDGSKMESYLLNSPIAKSQAIQRKGRAGRVYPGFCYRMYTEETFKAMAQNKEVDIRTKDFTSDLMDLWMTPNADGSQRTLEDLILYIRELLTKPSKDNIMASLRTLYALNITTGILNRSAVVKETGQWFYDNDKAGDIRITKALYYAKIYNCFFEVVLIASILLTTRKGVIDIFESDKEFKDPKELKKYMKELTRYRNKYGDFFAGMKAIQAFIDAEYRENGSRKRVKEWCRKHYIHYNNCEKIMETGRKLQRFKIPSLSKKDIESSEMTSNDLTIPSELDFEFKTQEDKIIFCLLKGLFVNLAYKVDKNKYQNLFPEVQSKTTVSALIAGKDSFFSSQMPKAVIYWQLQRFDSGSKFSNCVAVPEYIIKYLNDFELQQLNLLN